MWFHYRIELMMGDYQRIHWLCFHHYHYYHHHNPHHHNPHHHYHYYSGRRLDTKHKFSMSSFLDLLRQANSRKLEILGQLTTVPPIFGIDITQLNWNCVANRSNLVKSFFFCWQKWIVLQKVPTKMWKSNKNRKPIQKGHQWVGGQRGHKVVPSGSQGIPIRRQKTQKKSSVICPQNNK
jgi:hypothetical protein